MLANTPDDIALVRGVMGGYGTTIPDSTLMNPVALAATWAQVVRWCPDLGTTTDPELVASANNAQAYLVAARAMSSGGPQVTASKLADESTTFGAVDYPSLQREWTKYAREGVAMVCPTAPADTAFGAGWFTTACGRRG